MVDPPRECACVLTDMKKLLLPILVALFAAFTSAQSEQKNPKNLPKLSADEIVSKHLASIGSQEVRDAVKSRVLTGVGVHTTRVGAGRIGGPAQFATSGNSVILAMVLNSNDYPYEKIAFDGKDATFGVMPAGGYSELGTFLKTNKSIFKRGFFGGSLSEGWALLHPNKELKLESAGTAKIDDRVLYKLKVAGAGSGDMSIALYFEPETFRHVRTEYTYRTGQLTTPSPVGSSGAGATNTYSPDLFTLTEDFSNFAKVDDLVLPLTYVIEFTTQAGKTKVWTVKFNQAYNNQPVEPSVFRIS